VPRPSEPTYYLNGFSPNVQDILDNFKFRSPLPTLSKADARGTLINKFLDPDIAICKADMLIKGEGLNGKDSADHIVGGAEWSTRCTSGLSDMLAVVMALTAADFSRA
jgi:hypothetical protein